MRRYVSMDPKPWPSNNMNQEGPLHCAVALFLCLFFAVRSYLLRIGRVSDIPIIIFTL